MMSRYIITVRAAPAGDSVTRFTSRPKQPSLAYASSGAGPARRHVTDGAKLRPEGLSNATGAQR